MNRFKKLKLPMVPFTTLLNSHKLLKLSLWLNIFFFLSASNTWLNKRNLPKYFNSAYKSVSYWYLGNWACLQAKDLL